MADAAVSSFLGKVAQLLKYNYDLISNIEEYVKELQSEIALFKAFLQDCGKRRNESHKGANIIKELVKQIREVTYDAEDLIDSYVTEAAALQSKGVIRREVGRLLNFSNKRKIGIKIKSILKEIQRIKNNRMYDYQAFEEAEHSNTRRRKPTLELAEGDEVVGLEQETEDLVNFLTKKSNEMDVCAIAGMAGIGKTTLARKIFSNFDIDFNFVYRIWVPVSQEYNKRDILQLILQGVGGLLNIDLNNVTEDHLAIEVEKQLQNKSCLIVMDDVWTKNAWNDFSSAFPRANSDLKILVTTRQKDVGIHVGKSNLYNLSFLNLDNSWKLLQKRVLRNESCPENLVKVGKIIAEKCGGLPLAVVIIAGILLKKPKDRGWWEDVAKRVGEYVTMDQDQCKEVVRLSYDHLPIRLRSCFLYFGIFPQNFDIPRRTLIGLWISEGFIEGRDGIELEDIAEGYFEDLVDRNLVLVEKQQADGQIKSCRLHDVLHDWCKQEALEEDLFYQIKDINHSLQFPQSVKQTECRRLSVHSRILDYIGSQPSGKRVRSFLSMSVEEEMLPLNHNPYIFQAFKLLRVLNVTSITFQRFPTELLGLVHLQYVGMTINFATLPVGISKLWNLQTLIVKVKSGGTLTIKANLWKMLHLRYLHTNALVDLGASKMKFDSTHQSQIRILCSVLPECCTKVFLEKIPKLKMLGIRGRFEILLDMMNAPDSLGCFANSFSLEVLKLHNDVVDSDIISGVRRSYLPHQDKFPPNLRQITLSNTKLDWEYMVTLGMLPHLVVLKLKENAFVGTQWDTRSGGFPCLEVIYLKGIHLEEWKSSKNDFPFLKKIIVKNCDILKAIPPELGELPTLQMLDLQCTSRRLASSARDIQGRRNSLRVCIYPPNHDPHSKSHAS